MNERSPAADGRPDDDPVSFESYSPRLRTGLVLTGSGTDGAYHAGVLRAFHEAGVKIDIAAGRGIGAVGALFCASDGTQHLWGDKGFWRTAEAAHPYPWGRAVRLLFWAIVTAIAVVAVPVAVVALGLVVYPVDFTLKMVGVGRAGGLVAEYLRLTETAFAPDGLPTWLPRIALLVLTAAGVVAAVSGTLGANRRRVRGPRWWRIVQAPLSSAEICTLCWRSIWDLVRGAARLKSPTPLELCRQYIEVVSENLGQPGFRELVLAVHDLDARRDLVFAIVAESRRRDLIRRPTSEPAEERRAEIFDLAGVARDHLVDAVEGALAVPGVCEPRAITFSSDSYWRGETHRLCDRPSTLARLVQELVELGTEQVIVVSAAPDTIGPHTLTPPRLDGRGRIGEHLRSAETAIVRDVARFARSTSLKIFTIRPIHNPIGPFDFEGAFDDRSDRRPGLAELMARGYEDAYRQFIEPVVGGSELEVRS